MRRERVGSSRRVRVANLSRERAERSMGRGREVEEGKVEMLSRGREERSTGGGGREIKAREKERGQDEGEEVEYGDRYRERD